MFARTAVAAAVAAGLAPAATADDRAIVAALAASWNNGDARSWADQFWPDARFVNAIGAISDGREAIASLHARLFATAFKGSRNSFSITRITTLGPRRRLVEVSGVATGLTRVPPSYPRWADGSVHAHLALITEERAGAWRILYAQNTVAAPPIEAPAAR